METNDVEIEREEQVDLGYEVLDVSDANIESLNKIYYIDENGNQVEDEGRIELTQGYADIEFSCTNLRHVALVSKILGSIMEYISGYIQDYTSNVKINDEFIPKVLEFYTNTNSSINDELEDSNDDYSRSYTLKIPSVLFTEKSINTFKNNTQSFINGEKIEHDYFVYLRALKKKVQEVSAHNRFLGFESGLDDKRKRI